MPHPTEADSTADAANFECREPARVVNYFVKDGPEMDDPFPPSEHADFDRDHDGY